MDCSVLEAELLQRMLACSRSSHTGHRFGSEPAMVADLVHRGEVEEDKERRGEQIFGQKASSFGGVGN